MKILVADDERNIREALVKLLEMEGFEARGAADGLEARALLEEGAWDLALLDLRMPGMGGQALLEWIESEGLILPVIMISAHGEIADAVRALKAGARDFIEKPFDSGELIALLRKTLREENDERSAAARKRTRAREQELVGQSPAIEELRRLIERAAPSAATILITGESGTGKEVVAREIHRASGRGESPFVAVNLGSLPETLVESELFGHEKGAFTGAEARKPGLFELAGSGTLFLDEIGEMPTALQVKLLRALQDRTIRRVGGTRDIPVEARILAATNRDLEEAIQAGSFREDLYYRLKVIHIALPPLRERREDIPLLAEALLEKLAMRNGRPGSRSGAQADAGPVLRIAPDAMKALQAWSFPGNVRELENSLERASIYCRNGIIERADLGLPLQAGESFNNIDGSGLGGQGNGNMADTHAPARRSPTEAKGDLAVPGGAFNTGSGGPLTVREAERELMRETLIRFKGNRTKSAEALGLSRRALQYKIKDYGMETLGKD